MNRSLASSVLDSRGVSCSTEACACLKVSIIDPLADNRWDELVARHRSASVFHQRGWIEALVRTYGYRPLVLTTTGPGKPLVDGLIFCRVSSWITGTRLVSLPFTDHCEALLCDGEQGETIRAFSDWLRVECGRHKLQYIELRSKSETDDADAPFQGGQSYYLHTLDLTRSLGQIFKGLHRDCILRRIRRAERACLSYETGDNDRLLDEFYSLLTMTRRRHRLVPQPRNWFRNLIECMGNKVQIRLARKEGVAIAAILTLEHRSSIVYKYGCSDARYHNLGGMPFLFGKVIEESKVAGIEEIDFGRSDVDNRGLVAFKDHFGTTKKLITYLRYPEIGTLQATRRKRALMQQLFSIVPDALSPAIGRVLYRHFA
jgi:hypothetical protein